MKPEIIKHWSLGDSIHDPTWSPVWTIRQFHFFAFFGLFHFIFQGKNTRSSLAPNPKPWKHQLTNLHNFHPQWFFPMVFGLAVEHSTIGTRTRWGYRTTSNLRSHPIGLVKWMGDFYMGKSLRKMMVLPWENEMENGWLSGWLSGFYHGKITILSFWWSGEEKKTINTYEVFIFFFWKEWGDFF